MSTRSKQHTHTYYYPLALVIGLLVAAVGIAVAATALVYFELPHTFAGPMAFLSVCIGALMGSWQLARFHGSNGLMCGTIAGIIYGIMFLVWGFVCNEMLEGTTVLRAGGLVICCCIGGYCGMLAAEKRAKRHR